LKAETHYQIGEFEIQIIKSGIPWKENCYLLHHLPSGEQAIIDPGADPESIIRLVHANGSKITQLWLTHAHHDHIGAAADLCRRFSLSCCLHRSDLRLLHHAPLYALRFGSLQIEIPTQVHFFETPYQIQFGDQCVTALHTPGHTPGSVCYLLDGLIFTGDTLVFEHIGRTDLPGGDNMLIKASINLLLENLPPNTVLFGGHSRPWTAAQAQEWWHSMEKNPPHLDHFQESE
jgi:hydroxyacylglutathione hydrolase